MIKYSLKLLSRSVFINIFIALQTAVTLILTIICISSVMSRIKDYLPLHEVLSSDGECIISSGFLINTELQEYSVSDIYHESENIDEIYACNMVSLYLSDNATRFSAAYSYTENMYRLYTPQMDSGVWLDCIDSGDGAINAVTSYSSEYNVGDVITLYDEEGKSYNVKICGKLARNAKVISTSVESEDICDFRDMYENNLEVRFYMRESDIEQKNIVQIPNGRVFVKYKTGLNDDEQLQLHRKLYKYGPLFNLSEELNKSSLAYIWEDIILILPISICILVLSLICSAASAAVGIKSNLKTFLIFYICGARWRSNTLICLFNSIFINIVGITAAAISYEVLLNFNVSEKYYLSFKTPQLICCAFVILINILIPVAFSAAMLTHQTPKQLLSRV